MTIIDNEGQNQPPEFTSATNPDTYTFNIDENSANGSVVGAADGTDPDYDPRTYSITAGNTNNAFAINATSGAITVNDVAQLDYETTPQYTLTVQVSDGSLTDTATVTINVNHVNEPPEIEVLGDNDANQYTTPQLSVWRYLHVEDDSTVNVYGLMQAGTVNRQNNRFADAYIEPEYASLATIDASNPIGGQLALVRGIVHANNVADINNHRQSAPGERDVFWIVHVTNVFRSPDPQKLFGVTLNGLSPAESSVVFTTDIANRLPNEPVDAQNKVAVHEVAHQILAFGGPGANPDGHRGRPTTSILDYYRASEEEKFQDANWLDTINIMSPDAVAVPMYNVNTPYPNEPGTSSGPIDRYYFHAKDVEEMRRLTRSPGQ